MLMFLEALCPTIGIFLEIGGAIGPMLKACMHTRRACMFIDNDKDLCDVYLNPFIENHYGTITPTSMQVFSSSDDDKDGLVMHDTPPE